MKQMNRGSAFKFNHLSCLVFVGSVQMLLQMFLLLPVMEKIPVETSKGFYIE